MYFSEKLVGRRRYRVAAQAVWDAKVGRAYSRQVVLGPADPPPKVELSETRTVGRLRVGDVGALVWVAEKLDVVGAINRACGWSGGPKSVSLGEMCLPWRCSVPARQVRRITSARFSTDRFHGCRVCREKHLPAKSFIDWR